MNRTRLPFIVVIMEVLHVGISAHAAMSRKTRIE
jgi:hypothetical protein